MMTGLHSIRLTKESLPYSTVILDVGLLEIQQVCLVFTDLLPSHELCFILAVSDVYSCSDQRLHVLYF